MSLRQLIQKYTVVMAGLLLVLPLTLQAGEVASPVVPKASAKANTESGCVRPISDMRKNHMVYLMHQRDGTMRNGVRTKQDSLAECINCHVSADEHGKVARFGDDKHFCSSCHNYSAVSVDCFQCHNDRPEKTNLNAMGSGGTN